METVGGERRETRGTGDERVTLELWVRSLAPAGATATVEDAVERVLDLGTRGVVDDAVVSVWGDGVRLDSVAAGTPAGRAILDRVADVRTWARRERVDLDPYFERRTVRSELSGETATVIPFPVVTLVELRDGEVVDVAPCSRGGVHHCVTDALDRRVPPNAAGARAVAD